MKRIRMVVSDVDGTLLNTEFLWRDVWDIVGKNNDCPAFCTAHDLVVGISGSDLMKVLDEHLWMVNAEKRREMLAEARMIGREYLREHLETMPYAKEMISYLKTQDVKLCVATTTDRKMTEERLKQIGLYDQFDAMICGNEVQKRKPDPEIYQKICDIAGISPQETLVLEDTGFGVQAAYNAGCTVIMIPSVNPPSEAERRMVAAVVKDMADAEALIKNTFQLQ